MKINAESAPNRSTCTLLTNNKNLKKNKSNIEEKKELCKCIKDPEHISLICLDKEGEVRCIGKGSTFKGVKCAVCNRLFDRNKRNKKIFFY